MKNNRIQPVILSGGTGTRLWPLSRKSCPKQLLPLLSARSLLQETILRAQAIADTKAPLLICNQAHRFIIANQLQEIAIQPSGIILEPEGKNTAPAVACAALHASRNGEDPLLFVMPADHSIKDRARLSYAVTRAIFAAADGQLVVFGIVPQRVETGYGYIHKGKAMADGVYHVNAFLEKPKQELAEKFSHDSDYFWNSGMFVFKASTYLQALETYAPEMLKACKETYKSSKGDLDFVCLNNETWQHCPSDSIDYAILEKVNNVAVVPLDAGWSDIGSWNALHEFGDADEQGNVTHGDVISQDVKNSYLRANKRMLTAIGIEDQIIVETDDAVLVAHKNYSQQVKKLVNQLQLQGRSESENHHTVFRPWGSYETLIQGERFQVKRITINPGHRLSLQMHYHRSEHWVVVSGTATITRNGEEFTIVENQSTYIPIGAKHRLYNPGKLPLVIIEIQSGSYLGEDDIVRFADDYNR